MAIPGFTYTGSYTSSVSGSDWQIKLLSSGTLTLAKTVTVDAFLVGGGGGGGSGSSWYSGGGGGGGGYTKSLIKLRLAKNTAYSVTVGAGGGAGSAGGASSAFGGSASGGAAGSAGRGSSGGGYGGSGGSGGGVGSYILNNATIYYSSGGGGSDGAGGGASGGTGQGSTTRAFGESGGTLYSGAGGGGSACSENYTYGYYGTRNSGNNAPGGAGGGGAGGAPRGGAGGGGTANTGGGGGGGGSNSGSGGSGGSGIVILRNTRSGTASTVTASGSLVGEPVTITISRESASALHSLRALLYSGGELIHSHTIAEKTAEYPCISWTPALELYAPLVTDAPSVSLQIECVTYEEDEEQGSEELSSPLTLAFPEQALCPVLSAEAAVLSPCNQGAAADFQGYIAGYSRIQADFVDAAVTLRYGAAIASRTLIVGAEQISAAPWCSGVITGDVTAVCRVTDSRGFSGEISIPVSAMSYVRPALASVSVFRSDASGTADEGGGYISLRATAVISPLDGQNSCVLTAAVKPGDGDYGEEYTVQSGPVSTLPAAADPEESFTVRLSLTDGLGNSTFFEQLLPHRKWAMKFRPGGEGVAFGRAPTEDKVLEIAEDWEIKRGGQLLPWTSGVRLEKVWENSNRSASFAAQTISLPDGDYAALIIITKNGNPVWGGTMGLLLKTGDICQINESLGENVSGWYIQSMFRRFNAAGKSLTVGPGYVGRSGGYGTDNSVVKPVSIYALYI